MTHPDDLLPAELVFGPDLDERIRTLQFRVLEADAASSLALDAAQVAPYVLRKRGAKQDNGAPADRLLICIAGIPGSGKVRPSRHHCVESLF